jgi:hypothetical protein
LRVHCFASGEGVDWVEELALAALSRSFLAWSPASWIVIFASV